MPDRDMVLSADGDAEEFQRRQWSAEAIGVAPEIAREISRGDCVGLFANPCRVSWNGS